MNIKDAWLRHQAGLDPGGSFMVEGRGLIPHLLAGRYRPRSLLIAPALHDAMTRAGELDNWPASAPIYLAEKPVLDAITGMELHRGILALAARGAEPKAADVLARAQVAVVLEDLANHDNVGGIFRSVAALAGVPDPDADGPSGGAVVMNARTCDPLYRKAVRVSMGAAMRVPWARLEPWQEGLNNLAARGFHTIALTPAPDAVDLAEAVAMLRKEASSPRIALLAGAEGPGLSAHAIRSAQLRVRIPIDPRIDSLNVTVAVSIALAALVAE